MDRSSTSLVLRLFIILLCLQQQQQQQQCISAAVVVDRCEVDHDRSIADALDETSQYQRGNGDHNTDASFSATLFVPSPNPFAMFGGSILGTYIQLINDTDFITYDVVDGSAPMGCTGTYILTESSLLTMYHNMCGYLTTVDGMARLSGVKHIAPPGIQRIRVMDRISDVFTHSPIVSLRNGGPEHANGLPMIVHMKHTSEENDIDDSRVGFMFGTKSTSISEASSIVNSEHRKI